MKEETVNFDRFNPEGLDSYSDETDEILSSSPSWIVRNGILLVMIFLALAIGASSLIRFPDIVKTKLKITSINSPKRLTAKRTGKIVRILAAEGSTVKKNVPIAFLESTADHKHVMEFRTYLSEIGRKVESGLPISALDIKLWNIGELGASYQTFHQQYLEYLSTQDDGFYSRSKSFLLQDMEDLKKLRSQIVDQQEIQKLELNNTASEYAAYKTLFAKGVISRNEFMIQENRFLASKHPLQQTATSLLNNDVAYAAKQKELMTLEHLSSNEKVKFRDALIKLINEIDLWVVEYVLMAPVGGVVSYAGSIQENQSVDAGEELFVVSPSSNSFFGEIEIPQTNLGKVKVDQRVLIKLKGYPHEEFGLVEGNIKHISRVAFQDSVFTGKIVFDSLQKSEMQQNIALKDGMLADAEIITQQSTLFQRFMRSVFSIVRLETSLSESRDNRTHSNR